MIRSARKAVIGLCATSAMLGGCAPPYATPPLSLHGPPDNEATAQGDPRRLLQLLYRVVGTPYHYGGDTPHEGFDCSGLIYWASRMAGIRGVPRTVREQYRQLHHVRLVQLQPGDILFFHFHRGPPTHDGLYIGHRRFIHAPESGGYVSIESLNNPFWVDHLVAAARLPR